MKHIKWGKGPIIEKINFKPEQAVLACCSSGVNAVRISGGGVCLKNPGTPISPYSCTSGVGVKGTKCTTGATVLGYKGSPASSISS